MSKHRSAFNPDPENNFELHTSKIDGCTAVGILGVMQEVPLKYGFLAHFHPEDSDKQSVVAEAIQMMQENQVLVAAGIVFTPYRINEPEKPVYPWAFDLAEQLSGVEAVGQAALPTELIMYPSPLHDHSVGVLLSTQPGKSGVYIDGKLQGQKV